MHNTELPFEHIQSPPLGNTDPVLTCLSDAGAYPRIASILDLEIQDAIQEVKGQ